MFDIDLIVFESELNTFSALVEYCEKQQILLEYGSSLEPDGIFIMEDGESDDKKEPSFKDKFLDKTKIIRDKAKFIWEKFCKFIKKICQRIRIIVKKIRNSNMGRKIRKKLNELGEAYRRKKYNLPVKDANDKKLEKTWENVTYNINTDAIIKGKMPSISQEDILENIDFEKQTIRSFLFDYDRIEDRIQIQYDTLDVIDDVLNKYLNQKGYSMDNAVEDLMNNPKFTYKVNKSVSDDGTFEMHRSGDNMKFYDFSNGYYNDTDLYIKNPDRSSRLDIKNSKPIPFDDYCKTFESLEKQMLDLDAQASLIAQKIDALLQSTIYKDDIVLGNGLGYDDLERVDKKGVDVDEPWRPFHYQDTFKRHSAVNPKDSPYKYRDRAGKIFDYHSLYELHNITGFLSYSMNYMVSIYTNMKVEYDVIMKIQIKDAFKFYKDHKEGDHK